MVGRRRGTDGALPSRPIGREQSFEGMRAVLASVRPLLDAFVYGPLADDVHQAARHRSFIASQLLAGLAGLAAFPLWVAFRGQPTTAEAIAFAWLATPLLIAVFTSRTGRLGLAHLLSGSLFTGLILWMAAQTGGIASV